MRGEGGREEGRERERERESTCTKERASTLAPPFMHFGSSFYMFLIHPRSVRACQPKDWKRGEWRSARGGREGGREGERERESEREIERTHAGETEIACFGSSFYMFFSFTWACPMQIGLSQECCLFCLKSSLWSQDLPLTFLVF